MLGFILERLGSTPWQTTSAGFTLCLILASITYGFVKHYMLTKPSHDSYEDVPRLQYRWPWGIDLVVQAFKADQAGEILHFFTTLVEKTGKTFEQVILGNRGVGTIDPRNVEAILNSQFNEFGFGVRAKNFQPLLGHGIFTQIGKDWKASRDLLRPQFMHTRSENFSLIQNETEDILKSILQQAQLGTIDLQPHFFNLTLNTTMAVLVGKSYRTAHGRNEDAQFADAFTEAQHYLARRGRLGDFYWLLAGRKFRTACSRVHTYVDEIVQAALADDTESVGPGSREDRYVFLRALIQHTKDPVVLRDHLINVLLAGRDTTACLLSWTIRLLAQHPDVQERLRKACMELPSFAVGELPTKSELKEMSYLEKVLREVLRLYPSVPVNVRTALQTTTLPCGGGRNGTSPVLIQKGQDVGYCVYAMQRDKDLYGSDANEFRPDRWKDGTNTHTDQGDVGWGYLPFNGGPRVCLGREFALLEASYAIVRLLQSFTSITSNVQDRDHCTSSTAEKHLLTLVLSSADGCCVNLKAVPA